MDRMMSMHTRFQVKEKERLRKEKEAEMKKHGVQQQPARKEAVSKPCHGGECGDNSLYSHEFMDDLVFGPSSLCGD
jgi:hypothetical protein